MTADIFVPQSRPETALAGPLHTVFYVTADKAALETTLCSGLDLECSGWQPAELKLREASNAYYGFQPDDQWEYCLFTRQGALQNINIFALCVDDAKPQVRPTADGRYLGGATLGFPMHNMAERVEKMQRAGVESTVGVKELEFSNPKGETYISREVHFLAAENVFMLGVERPDIFVQVGKIDPQTNIGAPAYSARCVNNLDDINRFTQQVLGFELRRDMQMSIGPRSGLLMEEGIPERFAQCFAPGSNSGYLVFLEHGKLGLESPAPGYGPPNRGLGMWSFGSNRFEQILRAAKRFGTPVTHTPEVRELPHLGSPRRSMILQDPGGFPIEIFELSA